MQFCINLQGSKNTSIEQNTVQLLNIFLKILAKKVKNNSQKASNLNPVKKKFLLISA